MKFVQARHYHQGRLKPVRVVVVHSMEIPEKPNTAEGCAEMFRTTEREASAHVCVDADSAVQCVKDEDTAWAAPGANADGLQIEHAGYASQSREDWSDPYSTAVLERSARITAGWCRKYRIPARQLSNAQLADGHSKGFVSHAQVSDVFRKSDHTDPGQGFPWRTYMALVASHLDPAPEPAPVEDSMALTDDDAAKVASAVINQILGRSGPTVGVALQDGYLTLKRLETLAAAPTVGVSAPGLTRDDVEAAVVKVLRSVGGGAQ